MYLATVGGGLTPLGPPVGQLGGVTAPGDQITDGPFGLSPPGPHHTLVSAKFQPNVTARRIYKW